MNSCTVDPGQPSKCVVNMGTILFQAGDLVGSYRFFQPLAEKGDVEAIDWLVQICEQAGDVARAQSWRERRATVSA